MCAAILANPHFLKDVNPRDAFKASQLATKIAYSSGHLDCPIEEIVASVFGGCESCRGAGFMAM